MAFLTPTKTRTDVAPDGSTVSVCEKLMPDSLVATKDVASYVKKGQKMKPCMPIGGDGKPRGITIHNTGDISVAAGTNAAEQYTRATYNGNMGGVVVHYYVWHDVIWQMLRDDERGWHAADGATRRTDHRGGQTGGNLDTVAIEVIGKDAESVQTAQILSAAICDRCGFDPMLDIYTHNYWMYGVDQARAGVSKNCPVYILPYWNEFLQGVKAHMRIPDGEIGRFGILSVPEKDCEKAADTLRRYGFDVKRWMEVK